MEITTPLCALFHNDIEELTHFLEILEAGDDEYQHILHTIRKYHPGMANTDYIRSIIAEVFGHQEDVDASAKALEIENWKE